MLYDSEFFEAELKRWEARLVKPCTICKGEGSYINTATNKSVMCSCMHEAMLNAHLVSSGIPRKFLGSTWSFEGFHNNQEALNTVRDYATNFQNSYYSGTGLYIYGRQGRGKSMLEALMAKEIMNQINPDNGKHYKVCLIIFQDLVTMSHDARGDLKTRYLLNNIIEKNDLLIIDNLHSETGSREYNTKFLELILRKRDNNGVPTVLSGNDTPEQLIGTYSDVIHDFVQQNCTPVYVYGDNYRVSGGNNANAGGEEVDLSHLMGDDL